MKQLRYALKFLQACSQTAVLCGFATFFALYAPIQAAAQHGANTQNASAAVVAVDDLKRSIRLPQPAQRVVTLAPNLAELIVAAGGQSRLVGVSRYTDHPTALLQLPTVGDAFAFNVERIAALKPDLIVAWRSGAVSRQLEAVARLGIPIFYSEVRSLEEMAQTVERLGTLLGIESSANLEAKALRSRWTSFVQQHQAARQQPVRVFYQVWDRPLMTFNGSHLVSDIIRQCGGVQGFDGLANPSPTVSREAVLGFAPQLIVTGEAAPVQRVQAADAKPPIPSSAPLSIPPNLQAWLAFKQIPAVQFGQLRALNGTALTRMSPRVLEAAQGLCQTIEAARLAAATRSTQ